MFSCGFVKQFVSQQTETAFFGARLRLRTFFFWRSPMPDFEKLYHWMVNASEDALAAIEAGDPARAREILIAAERKAEAEYIEAK